MGSMAQTGLLLVPSDALGHTWALPGVLGGGQGLPPQTGPENLKGPSKPPFESTAKVVPLCRRSLLSTPTPVVAALRPPAGHRPPPSPVGVERTARLDRPGVAPLPASRAAVAAPAARPRILHTRRHDQAERAQCRGLVRAACEGRLWPQQVHQTDLKACRRRAVVARAETAAEEPSAVTIQRLPGPPSGSPCQL